jgi:hypothetical protein
MMHYTENFVQILLLQFFKTFNKYLPYAIYGAMLEHLCIDGAMTPTWELRPVLGNLDSYWEILKLTRTHFTRDPEYMNCPNICGSLDIQYAYYKN